MPALYPTGITTFPVHADGTEFIMASHVNNVQYELRAVQSTLGVNPHIYAPSGLASTTYASVATRLDYLQGQTADLFDLVYTMLDANNNGWRLPICGLRCNNHSLPCDGVFHKVPWNLKDQDTNGCWTGFFDCICQRQGWWTASATVLVPVLAGSGTHSVDARLMINSTEVAGASSILPEGTSDYHRLHLNWAGTWGFGLRAWLEVRHTATSSPATVTAVSTLSLTFQRATT